MKDGYAFPRVTQLGQQAPGMELRDWFAGMALQGLLAGRFQGSSYAAEDAAFYAFEIADAMIERTQGAK